MKKFLLLASTALSFVFLGPEPATAGPLIAPVLGIVGALVSGTGLVQAVLGLAVAVGSTLLNMALAPKEKEPNFGVKLQVQVGDDQPVSTCIGLYATSGKRKYIGSYGDIGGTPNAMMVDVLELGSIPTSGPPLGLWIDDKKCTILWDQETSRGFPIEEFKDNDDFYAWIRFHDGNQTQADSYLRAKFGDDEKRPWKDTAIGRGIPYAVMTYRFHRKLFRGGQPKALFEMAPIPLYDLRKDSTNGGNGPQRWNDRSTWEPSYNLPVMAYNVARGLTYRGEWFYGGQGVAAHRLPSAAWIAAANEASRLIERPNGETAPQFRGGLEITGDVQPIDVLEEFRKGMNGRLVDSAGTLKPAVGAYGASVFAITDDDIVITEGQSFDPFPTLDQTVNAINGSYAEPKQKWDMKDAPKLRDADLEARDGRRLPVDVQFRAVSYNPQAQRLMRAMLKEHRRFRQHQFVLPPDAYVLEPGIDPITWTSEHNGYVNKQFLLVEARRLPDLKQLVVIQEIDPADYDWSPSFELPASTGWIGEIEVPVQEMDGWSVSQATIADNNGSPRRPAIRIECADKLDDVMKVWVQVRLAATAEVVFDSDQTPYADPYEWLLSGNWCLPSTDYQVRGKYVPYTTRKINWSAWLSVTTPDVRLSIEDLTADIVSSLQQLQAWMDEDLGGQVDENGNAIVQEIQDRIAAISAEESARVDGAIEASQRYRSILDEIASIRDYASNADYAQYSQKEELRTTLTEQLNNIYAEFDQRITVATGVNGGIVERVTTLEVRADDADAAIVAVDTASVDRDNALAFQLTLSQAGTDNQFDPAKLWLFDTSVEGWAGNGSPTVANGYLRPANQASDAYVVSPSGLGANANQYRQVRARVRKTGSPTWEGYCWWKAPGDTTWDAARRQTVTVPAFDPNGIGLITFDMPWTGSVDQIRLDLSTAQTATDYFEFDWISIGAPSPGASRAELLAEQQARASGDAANAQSITALQALFQDVNGDVTALSQSVSSLTSTVTNLEDGVQAQGEAITSLTTEVAGKASLTALQALSAEVEAIGGGGIVSQGQAITAIRNELLNQAAEVLDQEFAAFLGQQALRGALTEASQSLSTRIEATDSSLTLVADAVTQVQAVLPTLATAQAVTSLASRVTAAEGSIISSSGAITALQNALPGKADGSALQALSTTVSQQGDTISSQGQAIASVQNALPGKADATALQALSNTVSQQGQDISAQSSALNSLSATLNNKADVSYVSYIEGVVADQGGQISAQASALTQLTATVGDTSAQLRVKYEAVAGPSGYARYGLRARFDTSSDYREAALFVDVPADPASPTQVLAAADRFALIANGGKTVPFAVDANGAYLQSAFIRNITTAQITFLDNSVLTSALAMNAAAERKYDASVSVVDLTSSYVTLASVTIGKTVDDYIEVDAVLRLESEVAGTSRAVVQLREGGSEVDQQTIEFSGINDLGVVRLKYMVASGSGSRTYSLVARLSAGTVFAGRRSLVAKRDKKSNA